MKPLLWLSLAVTVALAEEQQEADTKTPQFAEFEKLEAPTFGKILVLYEKPNFNITHSVWLGNIRRAGEVVLKVFY